MREGLSEKEEDKEDSEENASRSLAEYEKRAEEIIEPVAQGQYVVSDTRCPAMYVDEYR